MYFMYEDPQDRADGKSVGKGRSKKDRRKKNRGRRNNFENPMSGGKSSFFLSGALNATRSTVLSNPSIKINALNDNEFEKLECCITLIEKILHFLSNPSDTPKLVNEISTLNGRLNEIQWPMNLRKYYRNVAWEDLTFYTNLVLKNNLKKCDNQFDLLNGLTQKELSLELKEFKVTLIAIKTLEEMKKSLSHQMISDLDGDEYRLYKNLTLNESEHKNVEGLAKIRANIKPIRMREIKTQYQEKLSKLKKLTLTSSREIRIFLSLLIEIGELFKSLSSSNHPMIKQLIKCRDLLRHSFNHPKQRKNMRQLIKEDANLSNKNNILMINTLKTIKSDLLTIPVLEIESKSYSKNRIEVSSLTRKTKKESASLSLSSDEICTMIDDYFSNKTDDALENKNKTRRKKKKVKGKKGKRNNSYREKEKGNDLDAIEIKAKRNLPLLKNIVTQKLPSPKSSSERDRFLDRISPVCGLIGTPFAIQTKDLDFTMKGKKKKKKRKAQSKKSGNRPSHGINLKLGWHTFLSSLFRLNNYSRDSEKSSKSVGTEKAEQKKFDYHKQLNDFLNNSQIQSGKKIEKGKLSGFISIMSDFVSLFNALKKKQEQEQIKDFTSQAKLDEFPELHLHLMGIADQLVLLLKDDEFTDRISREHCELLTDLKGIGNALAHNDTEKLTLPMQQLANITKNWKLLKAKLSEFIQTDQSHDSSQSKNNLQNKSKEYLGKLRMFNMDDRKRQKKQKVIASIEKEKGSQARNFFGSGNFS